MSDEEILKLAKDIYDYDFTPNSPTFARIEAFYRAAYNKGIEDTADALDIEWTYNRLEAIRALEMK